MATVAEILQNCCPELTVLNANADLSRQVFSADITETPDAAAYIAEDTLVITTGMSFKDQLDELGDFIRTLHEKPVPALAIKLGRFIDEIPKSVLQLADLLQFPLLLVPIDSTLGMISHKILSYLWDSQAKTLNLAIEVQQEFTRFVLADAPVESMIVRLSQRLDRSVLYINPFLGIETQTLRTPEDASLLSEAPSLLRKDKGVSEPSLDATTYHIYSKEGRPATVSVYPVKVDDYQFYWLAVLNASEIPYPFSELVLEQVTTSLAFTQYKYEILYQNTLRDKEKFFHLLREAQQDPETFRRVLGTHESWYGLRATGRYQVVVAGIDHANSFNKGALVFRLVCRWLEQSIPRELRDAVVFPLEKLNHFAIVLQAQEQDLRGILAGIAKKLQDLYPIHLSYAIGNKVDSLDSLWFSHLKAHETYEQAVAQQQEAFIVQHFSKGVLDLTQFIPESHAQHFAAYILKDLAYPKTSANRDLRATLEAALNNQGDYSLTAKQLYLHRNTVKYRIQKVEELLGVDLNQPEMSLNLRMALLLTQPRSSSRQEG